jgi:hypothetical protein
MPTMMPSVHLPSMPLLRKRKSRAQRMLETTQNAMKVYTSLKVAQAGPKAAKQVAKGYAAAKGAKTGGKAVARVAKFAIIPAGAAGGYVVYKKVSGEHNGHAPSHAGYGSSTEPASPPVSTGAGAPKMGEPGAPKSGTTNASSPSPSTPGGAANAGGSPAS